MKISDTLNVASVYNAGLCTQCGTCAALCPHSAIHLEWDGKSGYVLSVGEDLCDDCGLCYKICPGHSVDFKRLSERFLGEGTDNQRIGRYLSCHVGHAIQETVRWNAASGGIVTALLVAALKKGAIDGAIVTRMNPESPLEPLSYLATTEEDILAATGSKYCPVAANLSLRDILSSEGRYAVVGLPCHIQGLRKAQRRNRKLRERVAVCISIFCGLNMSPMGTQVMLRRQGISKENVAQIKYRGAGWPGSLQVELRDGQTCSEPYLDYFDDQFMCYEMHRCNLCCDSFGELADISCGDAWLPEYKSSDDQGTSVVIVRSERGRDFLSSVEPGVLALDPLSVDKAIQTQRLALVWKKEWLQAKAALCRLTGGEVPTYENDLPHARLEDGLGWTRTLVSRHMYRLWHRLRGFNRETDERLI
jgi:coenzyme F420 hydrogenase subunit beta